MLKTYFKLLPLIFIMDCEFSFAHSNFFTPDQWNTVLNKVATGDKEWLYVARNIKKYTNQTRSSQLNLAVAKALPKNTTGVLQLVGHHYSLKEICQVPYPKTDKKSITSYLKETIPSLSYQSKPKLKSLAIQCIDLLKKSYNSLNAK